MLADEFGGGWNTDRGLAMAQNAHIASLIINDDDYNRLMGEAIASVGGEGAFTAHVVTDGPAHLEQEMQSRGINLFDAARHMTIPEARSSLERSARLRPFVVLGFVPQGPSGPIATRRIKRRRLSAAGSAQTWTVQRRPH